MRNIYTFANCNNDTIAALHVNNATNEYDGCLSFTVVLHNNSLQYGDALQDVRNAIVAVLNDNNMWDTAAAMQHATLHWAESGMQTVHNAIVVDCYCNNVYNTFEGEDLDVLHALQQLSTAA